MIGAVVLAAGRSARMGHPKALLPYGGSTFLGCVLGLLETAGVEAVRIVTGPDDKGLRAAAPTLPGEAWVENPAPDDGMLSSVRLGVCALPAGTEAFFLWPVDHPLVRAATVSALLSAWRTHRPPVVVPRHRGRRGHPVLFDASTIPEILSAPDDAGARHVVAAHADDRIELEVADAGILADIDTPEAYEGAFGRRLER
jgi:CTP:molybdopterin cytidylyltransferase MocA